MNKNSNQAFIDKLKTLNIKTGKINPPPCPDCGEPMKLLAAGIVRVSRIKIQSDEQAFAE